MITEQKITALRMERQHLTRKANEIEYIDLYRDTQPGQNVYWNGFGDPPSLTYRADFNDVEFNRQRQRTHTLIKGRFAGGNLGWIVPEDLELFAAAYIKPLDRGSSVRERTPPKQAALMELIEREGPLTIQQMKEETGMLVKEITPVLHRLQEAFLIYEDQYDGEWDRGWYKFPDMFPDADLTKYSRIDALRTLLKRFAYRHVCFDIKMARSFYKLPEKEIKTAVAAIVSDGDLTETEYGYILRGDVKILEAYAAETLKTVYAMHRNDFLVKSNEHNLRGREWLKERFAHSYPDTLYYTLIDGEFRGAAVGKFRYTPEVEDVMLDLPDNEAAARKDDILQAVHYLSGARNPIKRYQGEML